MIFDITVKEQGAKPVLSIRKTTSMDKLSQEIGQAYGIIVQYMRQLGEQPSEAPYTAYYNMDMENLDVEMGFPVSRKFEGNGDIKAGEIPAGKYVEGIYKGPYSEMAPAYDTLNKWMEEKGLTSTGAVYEYYLNEPGKVPANELLTKIVFPVK